MKNSESKKHFCGCIINGHYYCLACKEVSNSCNACDVVRIENGKLKFYPIEEMTCRYCGIKGKLEIGITFVDKERNAWIRPKSECTKKQLKEYLKNYEVKIENIKK